MITGLQPLGGAADVLVDGEIVRAPNMRAVKIKKRCTDKSSEKNPVYVKLADLQTWSGFLKCTY